MTGKTHLIGGVLAGACVTAALGISDTATVITMVTLGGVGGLFPDIDIPTSRIGSTVKPLSSILSLTTGHRGMFHAPLLYAIICYLAAIKLIPSCSHFVYAFMGGCASHLLLDSMNSQGIPVLWPFKSKLSLMQIKQDSMGESIIRVLLLAAILFVAFRNKLIPLMGTLTEYIRENAKAIQ